MGGSFKERESRDPRGGWMGDRRPDTGDRRPDGIQNAEYRIQNTGDGRAAASSNPPPWQGGVGQRPGGGSKPPPGVSLASSRASVPGARLPILHSPFTILNSRPQAAPGSANGRGRVEASAVCVPRLSLPGGGRLARPSSKCGGRKNARLIRSEAPHPGLLYSVFCIRYSLSRLLPPVSCLLTPVSSPPPTSSPPAHSPAAWPTPVPPPGSAPLAPAPQ